MRFKSLALIGVALLLALTLVAGPALAAKKNPMEAWKPKFDPSGAKYKVTVSNVSTPGLIGVRAGFWIRDALWEATKGQMYFDYRPFSQLGGEVEVLNLLQTGAIQGMSVSSVASTNLGPRMGVVNLPFLVNTYEKLDKFIADEELFKHFLAGMEHQGIIGLDITAYGQYGWATRTPVKTIADAKKEKFRTAEAAVNQATYKAWGFNPVVMPWPDVPTALKQGVITALDHTPTVCYVSKKFEIVKNYTQLNYAQGLFIWIFNKKWFEGLPDDLQKTFTKVVHEQCAKARAGQKEQDAKSIAASKEKEGVKFWSLPDADIATLMAEAKGVHDSEAKAIGLEFLKKVQDLMGFK